MGNFKKGGFRERSGGFGGRPKFGNKNKFGGGRERDNRPGQLFPAVCADCGKDCEVPFRPTGDKPVYCRDCFGKQRYVPGRNSNGADGPRPDFRRDFAPRHDRHQPEYAKPQNNAGMDTLKRQLDSLELKVNRILELVNKKSEASTLAVATTKEVPEATKTVKPTVRKALSKKKK